MHGSRPARGSPRPSCSMHATIEMALAKAYPAVSLIPHAPARAPRFTWFLIPPCP